MSAQSPSTAAHAMRGHLTHACADIADGISTSGRTACGKSTARTRVNGLGNVDELITCRACIAVTKKAWP